MNKPPKLLECFAEELERLRAFNELRPSWFNPFSIINTFRFKRQFKMDPAGLAHIAAESFVVEVRSALCDPAETGEAELPHVGTLKRVVDHKNNTFGAIFIPSQKLIEEKKSFAGQPAPIRNCDGFDAIEQDTKSNLESQRHFDKKFRNLNLVYLLESMCMTIAQNLLKGTAVQLPALGEFRPDLTFEPDQLLIDTIKARCSLRKPTAPFEFYSPD